MSVKVLFDALDREFASLLAAGTDCEDQVRKLAQRACELQTAASNVPSLVKVCDLVLSMKTEVDRLRRAILACRLAGALYQLRGLLADCGDLSGELVEISDG